MGKTGTRICATFEPLNNISLLFTSETKAGSIRAVWTCSPDFRHIVFKKKIFKTNDNDEKRTIWGGRGGGGGRGRWRGKPKSTLCHIWVAKSKVVSVLLWGKAHFHFQTWYSNRFKQNTVWSSEQFWVEQKEAGCFIPLVSFKKSVRSHLPHAELKVAHCHDWAAKAKVLRSRDRLPTPGRHLGGKFGICDT